MEKLSVLYASALFDLAVQKGLTGEFLDGASLIRDSLLDTGYQRTLVHPHIPAFEKQKFFNKVFSERIHPDLLGFLYLTTDKNREAFLLPALSALIGLIERYNGKITSTVYFASEVDETQLAQMKKTLTAKLNKDVEISLKIDPSIIGGPYILVDGYYIDWTVKKRMNDLLVYMKEWCGA